MSEKSLYMRASILDRLLAPDPGAAGESVQSPRISLGEMKNAVVRDLENLLNTRRHILSPPVECPQLNRSLYVYGVQDFTAENPGSSMARQQLRQDIERSVARFEPRLKNVRVHLETKRGNERRLHFRITGMLVVDPVSEPVTFDTYVDMNRGQCVVAG
jgi:type VI secretion system protein ImpF